MYSTQPPFRYATAVPGSIIGVDDTDVDSPWQSTNVGSATATPTATHTATTAATTAGATTTTAIATIGTLATSTRGGNGVSGVNTAADSISTATPVGIAQLASNPGNVSGNSGNVAEATSGRMAGTLLNRESSVIPIPDMITTTDHADATRGPVVLMDDLLVCDGGGGKRTRRYSEDCVHPLNLDASKAGGNSGHMQPGMGSNFCGMSIAAAPPTTIGPYTTPNAYSSSTSNNSFNHQSYGMTTNPLPLNGVANPQAAASPLTLSRKVSGGLSPVISSATSVYSTSTISEAIHMDVRALKFGGPGTTTESSGGSPLAHASSGTLHSNIPQLSLDMQHLQGSPRMNQQAVVWIRSASGSLVPQQAPLSARVERTFTGSSQGGASEMIVIGPYGETDALITANGMTYMGSFSQRDDHSSAVSIVGSDTPDQPYSTYQPYGQQTPPQSQSQAQPSGGQSQSQQLQSHQQLQQMSYASQATPSSPSDQTQYLQHTADSSGQPRLAKPIYSAGLANTAAMLLEHDKLEFSSHLLTAEAQAVVVRGGAATQKTFFEAQQALKNAPSATPTPLPEDVTTIPKSLVRSRRDALQRHLEQQWLLAQLQQQQQQQGGVSAQLLHQQELVARANQKWGTGGSHVNSNTMGTTNDSNSNNVHSNHTSNTSSTTNTSSHSTSAALESAYSKPTSKPGLVPANSTPALGGFAGSKWFAPMYPSASASTQTDIPTAGQETKNPPGGIQAYRVRLYGHRPEVIYEPIIIQPGQPYDASTTIFTPRPPSLPPNLTQSPPSSHASKAGKPPLAQSLADTVDRRPIDRERSVKAMQEVLDRVVRDRQEGRQPGIRQRRSTKTQIADQHSHQAPMLDQSQSAITIPPIGSPSFTPDGSPTKPGSASPRSSFSLNALGSDVQLNTGIGNVTLSQFPSSHASEGVSGPHTSNTVLHTSIKPDLYAVNLDGLQQSDSSPPLPSPQQQQLSQSEFTYDLDNAVAAAFAAASASSHSTPQFTALPQPPQAPQIMPQVSRASSGSRRRAANQNMDTASAGSRSVGSLSMETNDSAVPSHTFVAPSSQGGVPTTVRKDGLTLQLDALSELLTRMKISHVRSNGPKLVQTATMTLSSMADKLAVVEEDLRKTKLELADVTERQRNLERALVDAVSVSKASTSVASTDRERLTLALERAQSDLDRRDKENNRLSRLISSQQSEIERLTKALADATLKFDVADTNRKSSSMEPKSPTLVPHQSISKEEPSRMKANYHEEDHAFDPSKIVEVSGNTTSIPTPTPHTGAVFETMSVSSSLASLSRLQQASRPQGTNALTATATALGIISASEHMERFSFVTAGDAGGGEQPSFREGSLTIQVSSDDVASNLNDMRTAAPAATDSARLGVSEPDDRAGNMTISISRANHAMHTDMPHTSTTVKYSEELGQPSIELHNPLSVSPTPGKSTLSSHLDQPRRKTLMAVQSSQSIQAIGSTSTTLRGQSTIAFGLVANQGHQPNQAVSPDVNFESAPPTAAVAAARARFARRGSLSGATPTFGMGTSETNEAHLSTPTQDNSSYSNMQ